MNKDDKNKGQQKLDPKITTQRRFLKIKKNHSISHFQLSKDQISHLHSIQPTNSFKHSKSHENLQINREFSPKSRPPPLKFPPPLQFPSTSTSPNNKKKHHKHHKHGEHNKHHKNGEHNENNDDHNNKKKLKKNGTMSKSFPHGKLSDVIFRRSIQTFQRRHSQTNLRLNTFLKKKHSISKIFIKEEENLDQEKIDPKFLKCASPEYEKPKIQKKNVKKVCKILTGVLMKRNLMVLKSNGNEK